MRNCDSLSSENLKTYHATCDLGSNSFHLLIVRQDEVGGEIHVIDRIKEMVRMGGGISATGELDADTGERAIQCLQRFGQRLRDIPLSQVRIVGTQGLRRLRDPDSFMVPAEEALGFPIEIIAGREEARLIFLGVTGFMSQPRPVTRLVVDIGGGSTELIIGSGGHPGLLESLPFGCVSLTQRFFPDGKISASRWQAASDNFRTNFRRYKHQYRNVGWDESVGCSGTIRAIHEVCLQQSWTDKGITRKAMKKLRRELLGFENIADISLMGLSERRQPVFIGGVILLEALFQDLELRNMQISKWALREGVLLDLIGRYSTSDPRQQTIDQLSKRYSVDSDQANRVHDVATHLFEQIAEHGKLKKNEYNLLIWACQVHEIGLAISHQSYHLHSAYLIENSDMPGFSHQDQQLLAALILSQRGDLSEHQGKSSSRQKKLFLLVAILRLSLILCRSRNDASIPELQFELEYGSEAKLSLSLPHAWQQYHALTQSDLDSEKSQLSKLGIELILKSDSSLDLSR
ncbi:MAG: Ppx/GppA family phosphatase [Proteobacteria bacterium]|nr:Ppx/GppA family phosphatase [Pseudomonadota bacterium]